MIKVGLNIGNSKISSVVSDCNNYNNHKILSIVSYPTKELKKNLIINYEKLLEEIKNIITESEKNSQTKINSINLNIPAIDSISEYYNSQFHIGDEKISDLHLKKAINQSDYYKKKDDYFEAINYIIGYELDNKIFFSDPIGNYAEKIKVQFYKFFLNYKYLKSMANMPKDLKLNIDNFIPSPLSSALSTLSVDEKNLGTICIDLGHSTTSIAIFQNNYFIFADTFLVGSNNVTNDIARGVSTTISSAERLKTLHGSVISSPSDEHEIIEIPIISGESNKSKQINTSTINSIIKPRIEETLEIVWQKIKQNGLNERKIKNVVITGGGSELDGISEYAEMIFSSNVRLAKPIDELGIDKNFNKPSFSDLIGTILFNPEDFSIKYTKNQQKNQKKPSFSRFFSWIDQYI